MPRTRAQPHLGRNRSRDYFIAASMMFPLVAGGSRPGLLAEALRPHRRRSRAGSAAAAGSLLGGFLLPPAASPVPLPWAAVWQASHKRESRVEVLVVETAHRAHVPPPSAAPRPVSGPRRDEGGRTRVLSTIDGDPLPSSVGDQSLAGAKIVITSAQLKSGFGRNVFGSRLDAFCSRGE